VGPLFSEGYAPRRKQRYLNREGVMVSSTPSKRVSSNGHEWCEAVGERLWATEQMGLIEQLQCGRCGRDFIDVFSTGERRAVALSVLSFWTLSDDAT